MEELKLLPSYSDKSYDKLPYEPFGGGKEEYTAGREPFLALAGTITGKIDVREEAPTE